MLTLTVSAGLHASVPEEANDKTLSPYFFVKGGESATDRMPLKSTSVDVKIAGVIADVTVTQTYANAGGVPLEASYIFPASTRAAVYGMEMKIGERVLRARCQKREDARRSFDAAKAEGKSASLLEQQRPNVFQMNVANILPGDEIRVELRYTEMLVPENGEYALVFPTVVGPRYSNQPEASAPETERWVKNPYLIQGKTSPATFDIAVEVTAGMPIQDLKCATHEILAEFPDPSRAIVRLAGASRLGNDRDYILRYRLASAAIESGLLISRGEKENFFLLTVQPPKRVTSADLPPREYIFVVDVSGSMNGFPLEVSKALIRELLSSLRERDRFNVLLFSGGSTLLSPQSLAATGENVHRAIDIIDREKGAGGTELLPALRQAMAVPAGHDGARSVVVITDGFVSAETEVFDLIRSNLNRANLFAFGIGSSVNRFLIEGMARAGQGEPFIVTRPQEAEAQARKFRDYISAPVLTRISVDFGGFHAYDVEPAVPADVLADRPLVLIGKWSGAADDHITVRGQAGGGAYEKAFAVAEARPVESTKALGYLWARHRIAMLADYNQLHPNDERAREVVSLGLTYNLLTAYTSFVATDEVARNVGGKQEPVVQPLPLPQGVSNSAVGAPIQTTPEPQGWMLAVVVAVFLSGHFLRRKKYPCA